MKPAEQVGFLEIAGVLILMVKAPALASELSGLLVRSAAVEVGRPSAGLAYQVAAGLAPYGERWVLALRYRFNSGEEFVICFAPAQWPLLAGALLQGSPILLTIDPEFEARNAQGLRLDELARRGLYIEAGLAETVTRLVEQVRGIGDHPALPGLMASFGFLVE